MSRKSFGLNKERKAKEIIQNNSDCLWVGRLRGSFGTFDIIAFFEDHCLLISVKATKRKSFYTEPEIDKLSAVKVPDFCRKELWICFANRRKKGLHGWHIFSIFPDGSVSERELR